MLFLYIPITFLALLAWRGLNFYRNYIAAQRIGLPTLCSPVDTLSPLWLITKDLVTPLLQCLPFGLGDFTRRAFVGWNFPDFYSTNARLKSEAFTIVTPGELEVYVADAAAAEDILARQLKDFIKCPAMYDVLNLFGPNVNSVNGETWQRHRRITVPPFNERNSAIVWREALRQTGEMMELWEEVGTVRSTTSDAMTLALHVLTAASLGWEYSFREVVDARPETGSGHTMTYRNALNLIIRNMGIAVVLRLGQGLPIPKVLWPGKLKDTDHALDEFRRYLIEMVAKERAALAAAGESDPLVGKSNLMSVLLRSSDQTKANAKIPGEDGPANAAGLSDEEVYGNLFTYNLAGHDTTANTISYAITLMAVYPQWQEWIGEEVDKVFGTTGENGIKDWDYEKSFPKLQRCLALMYEILRLYGPVTAIPRYTSHSHQSITINDKTHIIPPRTHVYINLSALHTNPKYWGSDAMTWRPDRWIANSSTEAETLLEARPSGSFSPWAGGPRICPGKKFSQVEFVAVISAMMRNYRVEVVKEDGETEDEARGRVLKIVETSKVEFTLKMKKPERVGLRWVKRERGGVF